MTPFTRALERALALAATGRSTEGAAELRAVSGIREAYELFEKPCYDQLARVIDPAQLEPILQVWREIIAADPHACGPWGPQRPLTRSRTTWRPPAWAGRALEGSALAQKGGSAA